MDQRNKRHSFTFRRKTVTDILIIFLCGLTVLPAHINGDHTINARLDDEGFLELSVDGVNWSKLCDSYGLSTTSYFKVASVACKELGHGPPQIATGHFHYDNNSTYLIYNHTWCNVTATDVPDCSLQGSFSSDRSRCVGNIIMVNCLSAIAEENEVVLVGGETFLEGVVLIYRYGRWGTICQGDSGDTVCRQLDLGSSTYFSGHLDMIYTPPVLEYMFCDSSDQTVEMCSKSSFVSSCDPDTYVKVSCTDDLPDGNRRGGGSYSYFVIFVGVIIVVGITIRRFAVKSRARQRQQNACGASGVPAVSSNINQQGSAPSSFSTANYPRQQTQSSSFQGYQWSGFQAAENAPPYPATMYQSPTAPYPPPPNNSGLPTYDDAIKSQTPIQQ